MDFPALSSYEQWLVDLAQNIGLSSGEGAVTPWAEIESYLNLSGLELTMWEIKTIRFLSTVYVNGLYEFSDEKQHRRLKRQSLKNSAKPPRNDVHGRAGTNVY